MRREVKFGAMTVKGWDEGKMKTFADLKFHPHASGNGIQAIMRFENGRGVSVVQFDGSYGHQQGLYELAVLDKDGNIDYSTAITNDVLGWLTINEVSEAMNGVELLT